MSQTCQYCYQIADRACQSHTESSSCARMHNQLIARGPAPRTMLRSRLMEMRYIQLVMEARDCLASIRGGGYLNTGSALMQMQTHFEEQDLDHLGSAEVEAARIHLESVQSAVKRTVGA